METLKIGQLAQRAQVNVDTVRYYERRGLIAEPARRKSGYRQYTSADVDRIRFIKRAQDLGFTLNEILDLLELRVDPDTTCDEVKQQAEAKITDIAAKIQTLQQMKRVLSRLVASCDARAPTSECPILEALETKYLSMTAQYV